MYDQISHHMPLVGGYITRDPTGTAELRAFVDRLLSPSLYKESLMRSPTPAERLAILQQLKVAEVIAHPSLMTDRGAKLTLDYLPTILGPANYQGDDLSAWHVPTAAKPASQPALFLAEEGWQPTQKGKGARLKQQGLLFIFAPDSGKKELTLEMTAMTPGKSIAIGPSVFMTAAEGMTTVRPEIDLQQGFNYFPIRFLDCSGCSADFWHISLR
jgi:hypothetical protein